MKKKLEDYYIIKNGKKLHYGYTTGTCAAAATRSALTMLLSHENINFVTITPPFGVELTLPVLDIIKTVDEVSCAIKKNGGDDPDNTHGINIVATVKKNNLNTHQILGGKGVGVVTQKGLEQEVGMPAINKTPREMILKSISEICQKYGYEGGITTTISVPLGEEVAKKTFNPRLGIMGGISILGTTGIVVPMSTEALLKSIEVEMKMRLAHRDYLLITPGNYGEKYVKDHTPLPFEENLKCSNFIGKTIEMAQNNGAKGILFISHIGKFVKVAGGIMDTHSKEADCRAEIMAATAIRAGASLQVAKDILASLTTDQSLAILDENNLLPQTMELLMEKIHFYLKNKSELLIGAVVFSNAFGYLGQTKEVQTLLNYFNTKEKE